MVPQMREGMLRQSITLPILTIAKIRTVIRGKRIQVSITKKRDGILDCDRPMSVSDYLQQLAERELANINPDVQEMMWMADKAKQTMELRRRADAAVEAGANRKPRSEWKKPGRVAGKKYPKIDAAMAELGKRMRGVKKPRKNKKAVSNEEQAK